MRLHRILKYAVVAQILLVLALLVMGGVYLSAPISAALISAPLILSYFLVIAVPGNASEVDFMLSGAALGAFLANFILQQYFLYFYFQSIYERRTLGAGEGYWLLFTWGGGIQATIVGATLGALVAGIYVLLKPNS